MNNGDLEYHTMYSHTPQWLDCDPCRCLRETDDAIRNQQAIDDLESFLDRDDLEIIQDNDMPDDTFCSTGEPRDKDIPLQGSFRSMIGYPEQFPGIFFNGWGKALGVIWKDYKRLFKKLKYGTGYKALKHFIQRGRRGYSDQDLWDLNTYIEKVLSTAIPELADRTHSFPGDDFKTPFEWQSSCYWAGEQFKRLHEDNFWDDEEETRVDIAVYDWFNKYHASLWD